MAELCRIISDSAKPADGVPERIDDLPTVRIDTTARARRHEVEAVVTGEIRAAAARGVCAERGHVWTRWLPIEGNPLVDAQTKVAYAYERLCAAGNGCTVRQLAQNLRVDGFLKETADGD